MRRYGVRRGLAAAVAVAAVHAPGLAPAPAEAHGEYPSSVRAVLERVAPALPPGVEVRLPPEGPPRIFAANAGPDRLEALDERGRAFLRIGPRGVWADVAAPAWYRSGNPDGIGSPPPGVADDAPPRWRRVSTRPAWTWFDRRLHPPLRLPPGAGERAEPARLAEWRLELRHAGRAVEAAGRIELRPPTGAVVAELAVAGGGVAGLRAAVLPGAVPALYVELAGARSATVLGAEGEPFARIGPRGAWINVRSPLAAADAEIRGARRPPAAVDPRARPRWRRAGDAPRLAWFDPRLRAPPPAETVVHARRPAELLRWSVPVEQAGGGAALAGVTRWVPAAQAAPAAPRPGDDARPEALAAALVTAAAALGGLAARRRRARRRASAAAAAG